jgi:hypothetical protein
MYWIAEDVVNRRLVRRSDAGYAKGSAWILEEQQGRILAARYLPPSKV